FNCPITVMSAMPTSGTVAFDTIIGIAIASTSRLRSVGKPFAESCNEPLFPSLAASRPKQVEYAGQEPKRYDNDRAAHHVAQNRTHGVETQRADPFPEP